MNQNEFSAAFEANVELKQFFLRIQDSAQDSGKKAFDASQLSQLVDTFYFWQLFYPVMHFLISNVGLPWLSSAVRWSELARYRFEAWLDEQARQQGIDPGQAKIVFEASVRQLEAENAPKKGLEDLAKLLKNPPEQKDQGE